MSYKYFAVSAGTLIYERPDAGNEAFVLSVLRQIWCEVYSVGTMQDLVMHSLDVYRSYTDMGGISDIISQYEYQHTLMICVAMIDQEQDNGIQGRP